MSDDIKAAAERLRTYIERGGEWEQDEPESDEDNAAYRNSGRFETDLWDAARAYLTEHPADDDEPIDEAWLRSVGFKGKHNRSGLWLKGADYNLWAFCEPSWLIWAIGSQQIKAPANRGECRRLCSALGISLKEPTP